MVSGDVEDNLTFMVGGQLGRTTGSHFVEGIIVHSEGAKSSVRNVGYLIDFRQRMSTAFNQAQGSASVFWCPLDGLHDLLDQLQ